MKKLGYCGLFIILTLIPAEKRSLENPESTPSKVVKRDIDYFSTLAPELKLQIFGYLALDPETALKSIKALSQTNKTFYQLINNYQFTQELLALVSQKAASSYFKRTVKGMFLLANMDFIESQSANLWPKAQEWLKDAQQFKQAILQSDLESMQFIRNLIKKGFDINTYLGFRSKSALNMAIKANDSIMVDFLLKRGASVNKTPIIEAGIIIPDDLFITVMNEVDIIIKSDERDRNFERLNKYGKIIKLLAHHGSDINVKDRQGVTRLHHAAYNHSVTLVQALLEAGANPNITDNRRNTPLDFAKGGREESLWENKQKTIRLLEKAMRK